MDKKNIVFDFDGVIHRYSEGWKDGSIYDIPTVGIKETIAELREEYKVVVVSTRCATKKGKKEIKEWLDKYEIEVDDIMDTKPPASMYIDDRGINFNGNCKTLMRDIKNFKPWTEKARKKCPICQKEFFIDKNTRLSQKYCSMECRVKGDIENAETRMLNAKHKGFKSPWKGWM